jgi:hypothetical protein
MTDDEHLIGWGKVSGNLLSLEHLLRLFLCEAHGEKLEYPQPGQHDVALTHLTNRDSLGDIIAEFNAQLRTSEGKYGIEIGVVGIRDALAHGRLVTLTAYPLTLYKFGRPQQGRASVENADLLDVAWFEKKRSLVRDQIDKVIGCSRDRGYKIIKP